MRLQSTAIALILAAGTTPALAQTASQPTGQMASQPAGQTTGAGEADIISLADWRYDPMYREGVSARELMDMDIYGAGADDDIGEVEDIIASRDGRILALVAEVGGFIDIGDTHVSVPWEEIEVGVDGVVLPFTEETVEDYGVFDREFLTAAAAGEQMVGGVDDARTGPEAYRLSELIGDYARLRADGDTYRNYGYVRDVIIQDGTVDAVVVSPATGLGFGTPGYRAYPYYGYGVGYGPYYDMPYGESEVGGVEPFDYEAMDAS